MKLIFALILLMCLIGAIVVLLAINRRSSSKGVRRRSQSAVSANLRSLVASQREQQRSLGGIRSDADRRSLAAAAAAEVDSKVIKAESNQEVTLEKKLIYANWPITPIQYRGIQAGFTAAFFLPAYLYATIFIQLLVLFLTPRLVNVVLQWFIDRRFGRFDEDYPVLLLQFVSLLKTGMSTLTGLESAAKGLDEGSLVRQEVALLIERLRLGLTEEQAINAFGEDIPHPELELFVQSLLLSRRVGGTLSTTLERLAQQVRKRQQFRKQAVAAVGMEKNSIYMIAAIMSALLIYLAFQSPELVFPAFHHKLGNKIFQAGIALVLVGFYWSSQVTKIKV